MYTRHQYKGHSILLPKGEKFEEKSVDDFLDAILDKLANPYESEKDETDYYPKVLDQTKINIMITSTTELGLQWEGPCIRAGSFRCIMQDGKLLPIDASYVSGYAKSVDEISKHYFEELRPLIEFHWSEESNK